MIERTLAVMSPAISRNILDSLDPEWYLVVGFWRQVIFDLAGGGRERGLALKWLHSLDFDQWASMTLMTDTWDTGQIRDSLIQAALDRIEQRRRDRERRSKELARMSALADLRVKPMRRDEPSRMMAD